MCFKMFQSLLHTHPIPQIQWGYRYFCLLEALDEGFDGKWQVITNGFEAFFVEGENSPKLIVVMATQSAYAL